MKLVPLLLCDYYKLVHNKYYDSSITKLVSYYTPRSSRLPMGDNQYVIMFGLQSFIKEYLIDKFNNEFFNKPCDEIIEELKEFLGQTFVLDEDFIKKVEDLHKLGYLPLEIRAIPEGSKGAIKCPIIELSTTNPKFPWIGEFIESMISSYIWKPMIDANVAHWYRTIVDEYYNDTCDDEVPHNTAMSEFGFRGADSPESGVHSGAAWLTSFRSTATCGAIKFIEKYYGGSLSPINSIGGGMRSTEHSIMCSSYSIDGDEESFIERLLTKLAPTGNVSMVSDSYDYWNVVNNILPKLKDKIMSRNGTLYVRGDSGDPILIIAGYYPLNAIHYIDIENDIYTVDEASTTIYNTLNIPLRYYCGKYEGKYYQLKIGDRGILEVDFDKEITEWEAKGTVEVLYDEFGGYINSKGYKVIDNHIRAIYGDSITHRRAKLIYEILSHKEFAANNVALGAGSFSFHAYESEDGTLYPYTRDTYGSAIKATYAEYIDNTITRSINVFKNPVTCDNTDVPKKSLKGCCQIKLSDDGMYHLVTDGLSFNESRSINDNGFITYFLDGNLCNSSSIDEIRTRLYRGKF